MLSGARENLGRNAHVIDLADPTDMVAILPEELGHRHHVGKVLPQIPLIAEHAVGVRIKASHHRRPRGSAHGILAVHALKPNPSLCQPIQVRRPALGVSESAQRRVQIVRHE